MGNVEIGRIEETKTQMDDADRALHAINALLIRVQEVFASSYKVNTISTRIPTPKGYDPQVITVPVICLTVCAAIGDTGPQSRPIQVEEASSAEASSSMKRFNDLQPTDDTGQVSLKKIITSLNFHVTLNPLKQDHKQKKQRDSVGKAPAPPHLTTSPSALPAFPALPLPSTTPRLPVLSGEAAPKPKTVKYDDTTEKMISDYGGVDWPCIEQVLK